jgi:hypothetical protein
MWDFGLEKTTSKSNEVLFISTTGSKGNLILKPDIGCDNEIVGLQMSFPHRNLPSAHLISESLVEEDDELEEIHLELSTFHGVSF